MSENGMRYTNKSNSCTTVDENLTDSLMAKLDYKITYLLHQDISVYYGAIEKREKLKRVKN
jgi:hypothetical protein